MRGVQRAVRVLRASACTHTERMPEQQRAGYRNPAAPEAVAQDGQAPQRARGRIGGQQVVAQLRLAVRQEDQRALGRHAPAPLVHIQHLRAKP